MGAIFQLTTSRRGRLKTGQIMEDLIVNFNSLPHAEVDHVVRFL